MLLLSICYCLSCAYKSPESHGEIVGSYSSVEKQRVWEAVLLTLEQMEIPVARKDFGRGTIFSDSFDVTPEQVDCGKNFFGADYVGTRRGVLKITIREKEEIRIEFELEALLTIKANNKQVECTSFGSLEEEILQSVELKLGMKRDRIEAQGW